MRPDTIKLLEENIGRTLSDINHSNIFFNLSPRVMEIQTKIYKWDLMKLKSFCTVKETINKTNRQPTEWEKIFANDVTTKGLHPKIYKQVMWLNIIQTTQSKMGRRPKETFLQRMHTDGQEAHEKMFNITNYSRNANQNYIEISPHTSQNGYHQKIHKQ